MLQIYTFDPMAATTLERVGPPTVTVSIPYERTYLGPRGRRIKVLDFDGTNDCYYEPANLNHTDVALQNGLPPSESDPRFHQQMVYAVAMRVLEGFDKAIGRPLRPRGGRLTLFPHAFYGANAFYDSQTRSVLFGYFRTSATDHGLNLPDQMVYTCLSHDIIAHEVSHALVDRLRPSFLIDSNEDVAALHEAFADIVAIFMHFTLPGVIQDVIAHTRADLRDPTPLLELARQFGFATGKAAALRSALDVPDPSRSQNEHEPHERGAILVAAIFDAFLTIYKARIADLIRMATGGSGILPPGALPPDLVTRVSAEATKTAGRLLNICLRAIDYLPPLDPTFGDFLRALVTSDRILFPLDEGGMRLALVDGFRRRGIYPREVSSLAEEALAWEDTRGHSDLTLNLHAMGDWLLPHVQALSPYSDLDPDPAQTPDEQSTAERRSRQKEELHSFANTNRARLGFAEDVPIRLDGFHPVVHFNEEGAPYVAFVVQYTQPFRGESVSGIVDVLGDSIRDLRSGTTVIADVKGRIRHVISKPLGQIQGSDSRGLVRLESVSNHVRDRNYRDRYSSFSADRPRGLRVNLSHIHSELR
jgi:hypothetical protein